MGTTSTDRRGGGYAAAKDRLLNRLRRIEGQVRGVQRMVDSDRYCIDVLTQIAAIEAALDEVTLALLDGHIQTCVVGVDPAQQPDRARELMATVARFLKRG